MRASTFLIASILFAATACSDDSTGPGATADGRLQVVPGIPALPLVDVVVDGQVALANVAYGVPSAAIELPLGQHDVKVVPAGTAASPGGTRVNLQANDTTIVVVIGTATAATPVGSRR